MDFWSMFTEAARQYGIFAALFFALLAWLLYTNNQREQRYIQREDKYVDIIEKLSDSFQNLEKDVQQIKNKLWS